MYGGRCILPPGQRPQGRLWLPSDLPWGRNRHGFGKTSGSVTQRNRRKTKQKAGFREEEDKSQARRGKNQTRGGSSATHTQTRTHLSIRGKGGSESLTGAEYKKEAFKKGAGGRFEKGLLSEEKDRKGKERKEKEKEGEREG